MNAYVPFNRHRNNNHCICVCFYADIAFHQIGKETDHRMADLLHCIHDNPSQDSFMK